MATIYVKDLGFVLDRTVKIKFDETGDYLFLNGDTIALQNEHVPIDYLAKSTEGFIALCHRNTLDDFIAALDYFKRCLEEC